QVQSTKTRPAWVLSAPRRPFSSRLHPNHRARFIQLRRSEAVALGRTFAVPLPLPFSLSFGDTIPLALALPVPVPLVVAPVLVAPVLVAPVVVARIIRGARRERRVGRRRDHHAWRRRRAVAPGRRIRPGIPAGLVVPEVLQLAGVTHRAGAGMLEPYARWAL